jgi:IS30 family transposase
MRIMISLVLLAVKGDLPMSTYLTYDERLEIEAGLKEGLSFGAIGKKLGKDRTTIAKEIKKHSYEKKSGYPGWPYNPCRNRYNCVEKKLCNRDKCRRPSTPYCKYCSYCHEVCNKYEEEVCVMKVKPPYVCNGCGQLQRCSLKKTVYDAYDSHIAFSQKISEARSGILSNEKEISRLNSLISPLIRNGHSIHQIYINHADELMCSEKTIYNYVDACLFDVRNIDLPRKVRYRLRSKKPEFKIDRGCRNGRTYADFLVFIEKCPDVPIVQMDSLMGSRGSKVLLTIHFVETSLMLAFLRDANTSQSVIDIFHDLRKKLGINLFQKLFPVILTDNGSEFSNPKAIEKGPDGLSQTRIFYCDPSSPYQKGAIEVNHELIRRVIPKGASLDSYTQEDINKMMNHINSYKRKKLNNRSPHSTFSFYYGEELLQLLGCSPVAPEDIILKPELLKK